MIVFAVIKKIQMSQIHFVATCIIPVPLCNVDAPPFLIFVFAPKFAPISEFDVGSASEFVAKLMEAAAVTKYFVICFEFNLLWFWNFSAIRPEIIPKMENKIKHILIIFH